VAVFGFLWFVLINQLRVLWELEPQYSYGWAVPFLCAYLVYLAWERGQKAESRKQKAENGPVKYKMQFHGSRRTEDGPVKYKMQFHGSRRAQFPISHFQFLLLFVFLAFLYLPVRLIQAANPEWSLVSWGLALVVIGLTLWFLYFNTPTLQRFNLSFRDLLFPIGFFLVAVPWPTVLEDPLIQWLTRVDTRATVELVGWFGIPALPHGNVIEVATGMVGISDACSGIRSFQATLMISLFLGELYRLSGIRRAVLCLGGFAMSFLFNLVRMSLLVWVAASHGIAAIANWHDPAGVTILVACFCGLWAFAVWMKNGKQSSEIIASHFTDQRKAESRKQKSEDGAQGRKQKAEKRNGFPISAFPISILILAAWIVLSEIGVASWYHAHEAHLPPAQQWTIAWPTNNPTFKEQPLEADALQMLKCDESRRAGWQDDARQWQAIFIQWNSGTRVSLGHSPNICMTAAGHTLTTVTNNDWFDAGGLRLPFTVFEVMDTPQPFYIFYCLWNDRLSTPGSGAMYFSLFGNRLSPVLAGLRASGQRSLEIAVGGVNNAGEAESAVRAELGKILVVSTAPPP
jgi:exosortase